MTTVPVAGPSTSPKATSSYLTTRDTDIQEIVCI